jgi:hypothetical protein
MAEFADKPYTWFVDKRETRYPIEVEPGSALP